MHHVVPVRRDQRSTLVVSMLAAISVCTVLSACTRSEAGAVTQAVAKVNKEEVTELQVSQVLERQRGLKPEQLDAASQRAVTALVDQEIVYQKARELKLDRDPRVVQAIEEAKRELISRAYLEKVAETTAQPTADDVRSYYDANPPLFKDRRIYTLQDLAVDAPVAQRGAVEQDLKALKSPPELEAYLKEHQLRVRSERSTLAAESIPLPLVQRLSTLKPGNGIVIPAADGVRVVLINSTQDAPVTLDQARPAIETYLLNERKRAAMDKEMKSLRASATVEYLGKFKALAAGAPAATSSAAAALSLPGPSASSAAVGMDDATKDKGLSGLK